MFGLLSSGTEDLIRRSENRLCAFFGNRLGVVALPAIKPVLYVTSAVIRTFEVQCFAAQQSNGFGFCFAEVLGRSFGVRKIRFARVA